MIDISDIQIAEALLQHGSKAAAAKALNIGVNTLYSRIQKPDFLEIYQGVKCDVIRTISTQLTDKLPTAFKVINDVMNDESVNAATRLQAAQSTISTALKFSEVLKDAEYKAEKIRADRQAAEIFG